METEIDVSVLNSVNIKRFTKSVLEDASADINYSDPGSWEVTFPEPIVEQLDRTHGTLVFNARDREPGSGDLLVQPGTQIFSALLKLVQRPRSIGHIYLGANSLQLHIPKVLDASNLESEISGFDEGAERTALAFHFHIEAETPASFHREEMVTTTINPESQQRLPDLTRRLVSHLPQLVAESEEREHTSWHSQEVESSYSTAEKAAIDEVRPLIEELQSAAESKIDERLDEIQNWHSQRISELEEQLSDQRNKIRDWREKERNARKNDTRRRYIQNRQKAHQELQRLEKEIEAKKESVFEKEDKEIEKVLSRNQVSVHTQLLMVTEITYVEGRLDLDIRSEHAETSTSVSYLPATDEFHNLDCEVCGTDLTTGIRPQLCINGHLVGDPCSVTCRSCNLTYCTQCEGTDEFGDCRICWEPVCESCTTACSECGEIICEDHLDTCSHCDVISCSLCGESCATCGNYHCDSHLVQCPVDGNYHCIQDTGMCDTCGTTRCNTHLSTCSDCGAQLCENHTSVCETCNAQLCVDHFTLCEHCIGGTTDNPNGFCRAHGVSCTVGGEITCSTHGSSTPLASGRTCFDHQTSCPSCDIVYAANQIAEKCTACESLGEFDVASIPIDIVDEFRSVRAGANEAYIVVYGKKLLGRNQLIVYDRLSQETVSRKSISYLEQLRGG